MTRTVSTLALSAALLLCTVPSVRADDVADARAHFKKGTSLYKAKRYRDAVAEFEAAYRLKPHGAIQYNLAQCREKLQEWPAALRSYTDYLREVPDAKDRAAVRASIGRLEARLAAAGVQALLVYSDPPGAEVRVDGRPLGKTPAQAVLPPGSYQVALTLEGQEPLQQEVQLSPTASRVVDVVLRPASTPAGAGVAAAAGAATAALPPPPVPLSISIEPRPPPAAPDLSARPPAPPDAAAPPPAKPPPEPPKARGRLYTWIAAGVAVAAVGAGAYFGVAAKQQSDKLLDGNVHPDADQIAKDAKAKAHTANVLYAVGAAAGVAGVTLFFVEGSF
ncbi:MAG TPA: PEGA domain-containing protein [Anaeromyxobacter sp.]|nr:PEGA domain-containing protein [Anaeromyxobacter sp.]